MILDFLVWGLSLFSVGSSGILWDRLERDVRGGVKEGGRG